MARTSVTRVETAQGTVWRKRYSEGGRTRSVALLRWVARRLGMNALLAPYPLGADAACRTEQAMIRRLSALGARTPEILEAGERHLLLSDIGPTLSVLCRRESDASVRQRLLAQALAALGDLHRRGGHVSQAFARNITLQGDAVGFIDLEEDPATVMSLEAAQARDLIFFAHSTARFLVGQPGVHARLLAAHLAVAPAAVRDEVARTARSLSWLIPAARPFGSRARAFAEGLASLREASV